MQRREFLKTLGVSAAVCGGGLLPAAAQATAASARAAAPVVDAVDVLVAGGSCTGVFAAIRAAEQGMRVALIENNTFFGGMATAGLVPVWHTLYATDGQEKIIGGLTDEIEQELIRRGEAKLRDPKDYSVGCTLNVAGLQLLLDEYVRRQPNIRTYFGARVVDAVLDAPGHLAQAVIEDKSGRRAIAAKFFIDATGDADLTARAGFATWSLPKCDIQAHTLCAILAHQKDIKAAYPDFSFQKVMGPKGGAGLPHVFYWQAPIIGAEELTFLAATRVGSCDPSVAADLTDANFVARDQLRKIVDAVNRRYPMPEGKRLALVTVAPQLGLRESRHIKAEYQVTGEDVLEGRHFDDCIAKGSYRVDIHEGPGITFRYLDGHEDKMEQTADGEVKWTHRRWKPEGAPCATHYEIPMRAITPAGAKNLLVPGRALDCTREAYGALRVMVNCNQMGEAAGLAAAKAIRRQIV